MGARKPLERCQRGIHDAAILDDDKRVREAVGPRLRRLPQSGKVREAGVLERARGKDEETRHGSAYAHAGQEPGGSPDEEVRSFEKGRYVRFAVGQVTDKTARKNGHLTDRQGPRAHP